MKSIAAVALLDDGPLSRAQVTTAGLWMGMMLIPLGASGGIDFVNRFVPLTVVTGIQLGVGMNLAIKGVHMIEALPSWAHNVDGKALAVLCAILVLCMTAKSNPRPTSRTGEQQQSGSTNYAVGIYLFGLGAVLALIKMFEERSMPKWSWEPVFVWAPSDITSWEDWKTGLFQGALPQLPLTTLVRCLQDIVYTNMYRKCSHHAFPFTELRYFLMLLGPITLS